MKASKIIGAIAIIFGMFAAICTADGSKHELVSRCSVVALFVAGGFVGGFFVRPDDDKEDPYIEE